MTELAAIVAGIGLALIGAIALRVIRRRVEAAELARDSFRLELLSAWGEIDRYRAHLGLAPIYATRTPTPLRLNSEQEAQRP